MGGARDEPALPLKELNELKLKIFSFLPETWGNPLDFEETWTECTVSIGEECKKQRNLGKNK